MSGKGKKGKAGGGGGASGGARGGAGGGKKKETGLKLKCAKDADFAEWYTDVIKKAEMIDYYEVSGCYILRPWSYRVWEHITNFFDGEIKKLGVQNAYFPLFVPKAALEAEEDHLEGFAAEVAWVTRSGQSELAEPIAIRPTSETIMYPAYAKWIRSHRDLPLKLNQWTNIVRWEFKHPTPFLRTREFLWQEGHSAFATKAEADVEVLQILDLYARVYEELLAVPVIKGRKSEKEKFAGGLYTTTVEALIPTNGRAIQAATSHCLGQNFAEIFDITFEAEDGGREKVWQNSWGLTTRTIGVCVMVHGDDKGLVMPPRVAPVHVVFVYVYSVKDTPEVQAGVKDESAKGAEVLRAAGLAVEVDDRDNYTPGWKYNYWELRGVPLRLEIGPRDLAAGVATAVRRDNGEKSQIPLADLATAVPELLETIQADMLARARGVRDSHIAVVNRWEDFVPALDAKNLVLAPWCELTSCEEAVKHRSGAEAEAAEEKGEEEDAEEKAKKLSGSAKTLCVPFEQEAMPEGTKCFQCGEAASAFCLWGRSY
uniref:proline--tRNA ligase n=1 Tax=Bicosoecida sp. CB-2014 TaxID=1486930 RepID=A0A7S1GDH7_9STRA